VGIAIPFFLTSLPSFLFSSALRAAGDGANDAVVRPARINVGEVKTRDDYLVDA
jgi:hypothetical protein